MTYVDVTFFKSKSYFEFESSLLEFGDDELSLQNKELEEMSSVKDKRLQVYKQHTLQLASDPTTVPMSHVPVLDAYFSENSTLS